MKHSVRSRKRPGPLPMIPALLGILIWAFPATAPADDASAREILQCLQAGLEGFHGLTLEYEREILTSSSAALLGGAGGGDHASGRMDFQPPRFLKISQETPRSEIVVTDGHTLWWYIPEKREAHRYSAEAMGKEMQVLADVLQGLRDAEEDFEVIRDGHTETGDTKVRLIPDPPWSQTDHISLEITEGCRLRVVEFHNTAGNVTRFLLGPPRQRESFEEGYFSFTVPEGVRVVDEAP